MNKNRNKENAHWFMRARIDHKGAFDVAEEYGINIARFVEPTPDLAEEIVDHQSPDSSRCRDCYMKEVQNDIEQDAIGTVKRHFGLDIEMAVLERELLTINDDALIEAVLRLSTPWVTMGWRRIAAQRLAQPLSLRSTTSHSRCLL